MTDDTRTRPGPETRRWAREMLSGPDIERTGPDAAIGRYKVVMEAGAHGSGVAS
jgi:hypothetical protein